LAADSEVWRTAIAEVGPDDVIVRGYPLSELVGKLSFSEGVFLVVNGELPRDAQRQMLDAILVSLIEHGISPSTIIARTLASCGTPMQAAVAGSVASIADWHGGSSEQLAKVMVPVVAEAAELTGDEREAVMRARAKEIVRQYRQDGRRFEGFGHPQHPEGDPRANMLLGLAERLGTAGSFVRVLEILAEEIEQETGRPLRPNVTGALAALIPDLGFPVAAVRGIVIGARVPGLVAHITEELEQGGKWRHASDDAVTYTGPRDRHLT
jgi:citrate synthase